MGLNVAFSQQPARNKDSQSYSPKEPNSPATIKGGLEENASPVEPSDEAPALAHTFIVASVSYLSMRPR